jgi:hypothetical protein
MGARRMKILNSTVARVKTTVTRFDSKAAIRLHAHSFGLGVSPVDYDQPAGELADMNAICEGLVYSRDDLDAAPIVVGPIAAPDPAVAVTDMEPGRVGKFNDMIADWSMANWPVDDDAAVAWQAFQDARNAEEIRLRDLIWPQAVTPARKAVPKPITRPRAIARPKVAAKPISDRARKILEAHNDAMRAGFSEAEIGDNFAALNSRRRARALVTA